jgi:long-subunit fatty acid transport protein
MVSLMRNILLFLLFQSSCVFAENADIKDVEMDSEMIDIHEEEQKQLAQQTEEENQDYALLNNQFFENDLVRIYNYTAYQTDAVKGKLLDGGMDQIGLQDFYVSFGYGMEFKINRSNRVGYEYISAFPYDRGQVIRLFWIFSF